MVRVTVLDCRFGRRYRGGSDKIHVSKDRFQKCFKFQGTIEERSFETEKWLY